MEPGNNKYRLLIENLPDAFAYHRIVTDSEGKPVDFLFLDVNQAFEKITGLSKDKIIGKKVTEVLPGIENSGNDFITTYCEVALSGKSRNLEQYSEVLDRWYAVTAYSDEPGYFVTIFRDITESKNNEQTLRESEAKYRNLVENIGEVIYILDENANITYVSPSVESVSGYTPSELAKMRFTDIVHPDDLEGRIENFLQVMSGVNEVSEYRFIARDGRTVWVRTAARPVIEEGRVAGVQGVLSDITERKQAEQALMEKDKQQEILLDNIETQIWYLTDMETYGSVNQAHADFFGVNKEALQDKSLHDLRATRGEANTCIAGNQEVFTKKQKVHSEEWVLNKKGEARLLSITKTPKLDQNDNVEYVVCSAEDITERKEVEKRLMQSEERFQKMLSLIPDMISIHDPDMNIVYSNWSGFGAVPEEKRLVNTKCYQTYRGLDDICPDCKAVTVLQTKETFHKEIELPEGIWVDLHVIPILGEDGSVELIVEWVRDITGQKKAERDIQNLVENAPDMIVRFNNRLEHIYCNAAVEDYFGVPGDYLLSKTFDDLARERGEEYEPELEMMNDSLKQCLETRAEQQVELTFQLHGKIRHFSTRIVPEFNHTGNVESLLAVTREITDRKKAEQASNEYRERLAQAQAFARVGTWEYDINSESLYWSKECEALFGLHEGEFEGTFDAFLRRVHPDDRDYVISKNQPVIENNEGTNLEYEHRIIKKDGTIKWVREAAGVVNEENGKKIVGFIMDITERKLAEESLNYRLQFEKLVSEISSIFINLPSGEIDEGINYALKLTGEFFQVDRSYVFQFSEDEKRMNNTHEWCAEDVEPQMEIIKNQPLESLPWWAKQIRKHDYVHVPDVSKLPPEADAEIKEFQRQGIQSLLSVPLHSKGRLIGFLGFDSVKAKVRWTRETISFLQIIADILVNGFEKYSTEQKIRYMSFYDSLTGLYNRRFMKEEMTRLDTERQLPISIIMVDVNGLKLVNDTYGHATGDEMLKSAAAILKKSCRKEDVIARWGGDEFVILLPQTAVKEAEAICRRINTNCQEKYVEKVPVSLSAGYACKEGIDKDLSESLREAENYMYKQKLTESRSSKSEVLDTLLITLGEKSQETERHIRRMQNVSQKIAEKLDLSDTEMARLEVFVRLHDIGKINISENILAKKIALTKEDWAMIKEHPEIGYRIARTTEEFSHVAEDILAHHERWDGSGYPQGLKGKNIPLLARIVAIADAYEVMSNGRPYKEPMSQEEIKKEFKRCAGTQFDPELVKIFLSILEEQQVPE